MRIIEKDQINALQGEVLSSTDTFPFECRPGIGCFNQCCRNLNLFLYPYDVLKLRNRLGVSSDQFIDTYVDIILRDGNSFPDVLLTMADDEKMSCPFLSDEGCRVYADRPGTCRMFPMEHGQLLGETTGDKETLIFRFRPPVFCQGPQQSRIQTVNEWINGQDAVTDNRMAGRWADIKKLFASNPWGSEGPEGPKAKMAFMATYNLDRFRSFIQHSSFLKRYKVKSELVKRILADDIALLDFGYEWVKLFVWGIRTPRIKAR
jgi:uncharacterized protein